MTLTDKSPLIPFLLTAILGSACGGQHESAPSIDEQIDACYSHTPLDTLPKAHPDFVVSPAEAADGFAGTFRSAAGDQLTVKWDGSIDEVQWECDDRNDLPQTAGGATTDFDMPVALKLVTADGDFKESLEDTLVVRVDRSEPAQESTQVSTGDNLTLNQLVGDFTPPPGHRDATIHWSATFQDKGWTIDLSANASGHGDLVMPFWTRKIVFLP